MENEKPKLISVGELFAQTWKMYKANFKKLSLMVLFSFIGFLPLLAVVIAFFFTLKSTDISGAILKIVLGLLGIAAAAFYVYWYTSAYAGLFMLLKDSNLKIKEAFGRGRTYFWKYLVIGILTGFLVMLWTLLFIIPGIIFCVFYWFAIYALLFEDFKGVAALRRSKELVSGNWWGVFGRILIFMVAFFILNFGSMLILTLPTFFVAEGSAAYLFFSNFGSLLNFIFQTFFLSLIAIIYAYLIFKDLARLKPESKVDRTKTGNVLLVVVIFILVISIPVLATLSVVALENVRMKDRDAQRIFDCKMIQTGLELYANDKGSCLDTLDELQTAPYFISNLADPVSNKEYEYEKSGNTDCRVCFNLEAGMSGYPAGKNCLPVTVDKPSDAETTTDSGAGQ